MKKVKSYFALWLDLPSLLIGVALGVLATILVSKFIPQLNFGSNINLDHNPYLTIFAGILAMITVIGIWKNSYRK